MKHFFSLAREQEKYTWWKEHPPHILALMLSTNSQEAVNNVSNGPHICNHTYSVLALDELCERSVTSDQTPAADNVKIRYRTPLPLNRSGSGFPSQAQRIFVLLKQRQSLLLGPRSPSSFLPSPLWCGLLKMSDLREPAVLQFHSSHNKTLASLPPHPTALSQA